MISSRYSNSYSIGTAAVNCSIEAQKDKLNPAGDFLMRQNLEVVRSVGKIPTQKLKELNIDLSFFCFHIHNSTRLCA